MTWEEWLLALKAVGGSTDMQTSKTGRYPWLFHFCRGEAERMDGVEIYAHTKAGFFKSPPRDWRTKALLLADYAALAAHGGRFNDTADALAEGLDAIEKRGRS